METLGYVLAHLFCDILVVSATILIVTRIFDLKTYHILQSYCFALIFKCFLKSYIGVPLNPWMMQLGWAIPSGHTVALGVMYGLLLDRKKHTSLYCLILFLLSVSLVFCGYHNVVDILVALVCVWLLVTLADYLYQYGLFYRISAYLTLSIVIMKLSYVSNHNTQRQYFFYMCVLAIIELVLQYSKIYASRKIKLTV